MPELVWDEPGQRRFESGIDRGVLYPKNVDGVVWNGLVSVKDSQDGGGSTPYYYDGVKYMDLPSKSDFKATIEAITYPDEFEECLGNYLLPPGVLVTGQRPKLFDLSYRTRTGDDLSGVDGSKIHLVYNCRTYDEGKEYGTHTNVPSPISLTWTVSTTPVAMVDYEPTAHLIFDTRRLHPSKIEDLENILYGRTEDARMPLPAELITILGESFDEIIEPLGDPV